jgi:hypothetical protein
VTKKLTYGGLVAAILTLVGLAVALNDDLRSAFLSYVLLGAAVVLVVVLVALVGIRIALPRAKRAIQGFIADEVRRAMGAERDTIRGWVTDDAAEAARGRREGQKHLSPMLKEFVERSVQQEAENRKVRGSLNELIEELDYLANKIREDSPDYWATGHRLPNKQWSAHGSLLAAKDNAAHAAVSKLYYEADRLNHCVPRMLAKTPNAKTIRACKPEQLTHAHAAAKAELERVLTTVKEPPWASGGYAQ